MVDVDPKSPAATQLLTQASYRLEVIAESNFDFEQWQIWLDQILAREEILWTKTTKRGKKVTLNLREQLLDLSLVEVTPEGIKVDYMGTCRNDGTQLQPRNLVYLFEQVSGSSLQLGQIHRLGLMLENHE